MFRRPTIWPSPRQFRGANPLSRPSSNWITDGTRTEPPAPDQGLGGDVSGKKNCRSRRVSQRGDVNSLSDPRKAESERRPSRDHGNGFLPIPQTRYFAAGRHSPGCITVCQASRPATIMTGRLLASRNRTLRLRFGWRETHASVFGTYRTPFPDFLKSFLVRHVRPQQDMVTDFQKGYVHPAANPNLRKSRGPPASNKVCRRGINRGPTKTDWGKD